MLVAILDHPGTTAEVHLGFLTRSNLDPAERKRAWLAQSPHKALHRRIRACKARLELKILEDALCSETLLESLLDEVPEWLAVALPATLYRWIRPGGRNGRFSLPEPVIPTHRLPVDPQLPRDPPVGPAKP